MSAPLPLGYDPRFTMAHPNSSPSRALKSALLIANPIAGAGRGEHVARELVRELEQAGVSVEWKFTKARDDALNFAANATSDALISVGGDGTLNEVLRGSRDPKIPIGIVPLGTANVLALDLELSADPSRAARTILDGHTTALDTALVNGELSFLVVGVGFDAEAVRQVDLRRRGPISKFTYIAAGFAALWNYREPRLEVEIDGERVAGTFGWVLASNVIHFGGVFRLASDRDLGDGLWEVYLFERAARRHLFFHGLRGLTGRLPGGNVVRHRARQVLIRSAETVAVEIDGDLKGQTPLDIRVSGPRFRVFCPKRHARD